MISIFANIRVNDPERLEHLKDSFASFAPISDNWVINVRGKFRAEVIAFLKGELKEKMTLFELLDEDRGWFKNALSMMPAVKNEYLLLWNEDHINMLSMDKTRALVDEIVSSHIDYLHYGHYKHWRKRFDRLLESGIIKRGNMIDVADVTRENFIRFFPEQKRECIISSPAIFRKEFLTRIMNLEEKKLPFFFTTILRRIIAFAWRFNKRIDRRQVFDTLNNTFFFYKLPRFIKQTPFELEITQDRLYVLPVRVASPNEEFFACIDDDVYDNSEMKGYQLIKRGLYPTRAFLTVLEETRPGMRLLKESDLSRGEKYTDRYYIDRVRTHELLRAVLVATGVVEIQSGGEEIMPQPLQPVEFYPNISHTITALENASVEIFISAPAGAQIVHPLEGSVYDPRK